MLTMLQSELLDKIKQSWVDNLKLAQLIQHLQLFGRKVSKFTWEADHLCRKGRLVIGMDPFLRKELLEYFHGSSLGGHSGVQ